MTSTHKTLLILFFLIVTIYSIVEVVEESLIVMHGDPAFHAIAEIILVIISLSGLCYLLFEINEFHRKHIEMEKQLSKVRKQLESSNIRLRQGKKDYVKVIKWQFKEWGLTRSEQEIAMALLKGLSIKEIARQRDTQEKTVRKQASSIYDKSNLSGRHEFAAWFFEDLL